MNRFVLIFSTAAVALVSPIKGHFTAEVPLKEKVEQSQAIVMVRIVGLETPFSGEQQSITTTVNLALCEISLDVTNLESDEIVGGDFIVSYSNDWVPFSKGGVYILFLKNEGLLQTVENYEWVYKIDSVSKKTEEIIQAESKIIERIRSLVKSSKIKVQNK